MADRLTRKPEGPYPYSHLNFRQWDLFFVVEYYATSVIYGLQYTVVGRTVKTTNTR